MDFNKNLNILQARNLIACGFGIGVTYGSAYYIMNEKHNFDHLESRPGATLRHTNYQVSAFGCINTLKLCQEVPDL